MDTKKKKGPSAQRNPETSSTKTKVKTETTFGAGGFQLSGGEASHLVGRIVEKGISDEPQPKAYFSPIPPPKPSVLPFPVARHRSEGPHWAPIGSEVSSGYGEDGDGGLSDKEDEAFMDFDQISALANPVKRKNRGDMDFSSWKELLSGNNSSVKAVRPERTRLTSVKAENRKKDKEAVETARNGDGDESSAVSKMEVDYTNTTNIPDKMPVSLSDAHKKEPDNALGRREMDYSTSSIASSRSNLGYEQEAMSLERQIDAENQERLKGMSPDEIAEAQAEIMEKMDPALLKLLKKRGEERLKKQISPSTVELGSGRKDDQGKARGLSVCESPVPPSETTSKEVKCGVGDDEEQIPNRASCSLWNAWSARVEGVRGLRFSLDGAVLENCLVEGADADRVGERDYLRTEGDPGAVGYTIKEAVALTRSVIPGQRTLALHLLFAVLNSAVQNICGGQVGSSMRNDDKINRLTDWEAIWAYALGPEPELILSLRICLDDNHYSVALVCAKVIQCILTCDVNENNFDFSEKITAVKDICTAPVFRSRPEIDVGFLRGGFWKYNAKSSNILTLDDDIIDDETEGKHTIQDDIVVSAQDFAAGLVRMGILPRLRYLLESDPTTALEEHVVSILIAIARHSPTCADAVVKCERLVEIVVQRFTKKESIQIHPSMIKSVILIKVLARSDWKNCFEFLKNGFFLIMTSHLYKYTSSLDHWIKSGQENCKLSAALIVEQLRFWKVCIQHGYCISCFSDIFTSLCLWLNPPSLEMLIENGILSEFASISTEAYLVIEALAARLPSFFSQMHPSNQIEEQASDGRELWSWSHVGPIVDSAVTWLVFMSDLHTCNFWERGIRSAHAVQDSSVTSLLWVYSAVMSMLAAVLKRIIPDGTINQTRSDSLVPWLPEFVPKIGLEIIKNKFLSFSDDIGLKIVTHTVADGSFLEKLIYFRQQNEYQTALASVCCLHSFVQTIVGIDKLIQLAKKGIESSQEYSHSSNEEKILRDGIIEGSLVELKSVQSIFTKIVASEWQLVQSIEIFGRGGPAPGVGVGWGGPGGGYWSTVFLLAQVDAGLIVHLLETFQNLSMNEVLREEEITSTVQTINSSIAASLTAGPIDRNIVDKAFQVLTNIPVLKCLDYFTRKFLHSSRGVRLFEWQYKEEDFLLFSKILSSHFRDRWLSVKKKKLKTADVTFKKSKNSLDTIHEDLETSNLVQDTSLGEEWAHQRLPLPITWILSPIATLCNSKDAGLRKSSNIENLIQDPVDLLEVAKAGLFFLLGIEAMSSFLPSDFPSPVRSVPLVWKLHSLSVILLGGMAVIEEKRSRDVYEALQDLCGDILNKERLKSAEMTGKENENLSETTNRKNPEFLRFQSEIHDSYATFIETLVEQFSAISYGDLIYGRQVAIYLHRSVEASVRLAAWNALSNARVLELLPVLESCFGEPEGYLQPIEDNAQILEAYTKSWTCSALDRAASRRSAAYTLVLHHLSHFIFHTDDKLLRNKIARSLLRDFSLKQHHKVMMLNLLQYNEQERDTSSELGSFVEKRLEVLTEACERNSSLLNDVNKLKSLVHNNTVS